MSKVISIEDSPFRKAKVYRPLKRRQQIHDDYGLCVLHGGSGEITATRQKVVPRLFEFYNISHLWRGHGWLWTPENGRKTFAAGEGVSMAPGVIHDYNGFDCYMEDYICFAGPVADQLAKSGILRPGVLRIGRARVLLPIIQMAACPDRDSQIRANIALQNLLVKLYFENSDGDKSGHSDAIGELIREINARPEKWWSEKEMAEMTGLSVNQFIRVFSKHAGLTPKKYVDALKIRHASEALLNSRRTLASIAESLGFRDPFHLSKRFKALTGLPPSEYRRQKPS